VKRARPITIRPQVTVKSTTPSIAGVSAIQWKNPEKIQLESKRKSADVQEGVKAFDIPSNRKCQPITILRIVSA
jgi:hypothetical protein